MTRQHQSEGIFQHVHAVSRSHDLENSLLICINSRRIWAPARISELIRIFEVIGSGIRATGRTCQDVPAMFELTLQRAQWPMDGRI